MDINPIEVARGRAQCFADIASGQAKLFWQTRGGWGEFMAALMRKRFDVFVEHIGCSTDRDKHSFVSGYNDATIEHIHRTFGSGAFQVALDEVESFREHEYRKAPKGQA